MSNKRFTITHKTIIGFISATLDISMEKIYKRYLKDLYRNHRRNMIMKAVLDIIEKQIKFYDLVVEKFA